MRRARRAASSLPQNEQGHSAAVFSFRLSFVRTFSGVLNSLREDSLRDLKMPPAPEGASVFAGLTTRLKAAPFQTLPNPFQTSPNPFVFPRPVKLTFLFTALLLFLAVPSTTAQTHPASSSQATNSFAMLAAKADAARDAEHLDEAASLYRRALILRPSWAEGWWSLGTLEYDQDHYAKAAAALQKFVSLRPADGTAHAMLGLCEFELDHENAALRDLEKGKKLGLQKNPDLWHVVLYHEGVLLQRKGSFQAAQETLEELCLQTGSSDKAATVLGMTMLRLNAKGPPSPGSEDAAVVLGVGRAECLAGQKKFDEARPAFEQVVKEHTNYPNIHYAYGLFFIELRDVPNTVDQMKQEIANNPKNVIARLRIAAVEFKEDSAAGIPYAEDAVKLDPQSPFGHYMLGLLRLDVDDYLKAIPELEIAQKGMPREPKIYFALGTAYSRSGRKQDAVRARVTFQRLTDEAKKTAGTEPSRESGETMIPVGDAPPPSQ